MLSAPQECVPVRAIGMSLLNNQRHHRTCSTQRHLTRGGGRFGKVTELFMVQRALATLLGALNALGIPDKAVSGSTCVPATERRAEGSVPDGSLEFETEHTDRQTDRVLWYSVR